MANTGNLEACLSSKIEESVLLTLRRSCPSSVTSYENVLEVLTSKRNLSQVSSVFLISAKLSKENQQLWANLKNSQTVTPFGLIKTRSMPSGRLTALVPTCNEADVIKTGHFPRRHPTPTSNARGKPPPEVEYTPNDRAARSYEGVTKTRDIWSSRMDSRKRSDPVLIIYPFSEDKERSSTLTLDLIGSKRVRTIIAYIGRPVELGIEVTSV